MRHRWIAMLFAVILAAATILAVVVVRQAGGQQTPFQTGIRWERVGFAEVPEEVYRNWRIGAYIVIVYCDRTRGIVIYRFTGVKGADHMMAVANGCEKAP